MRDAANYNVEIAKEFDVISECGPLSAYVDTDALQDVNLKELENIKTVFIFCVLVFALFATECCSFTCCVCFSACKSNGRSTCGTNWHACMRNVCKEYAYFAVTLYKEGG